MHIAHDRSDHHGSKPRRVFSEQRFQNLGCRLHRLCGHNQLRNIHRSGSESPSELRHGFRHAVKQSQRRGARSQRFFGKPAAPFCIPPFDCAHEQSGRRLLTYFRIAVCAGRDIRAAAGIASKQRRFGNGVYRIVLRPWIADDRIHARFRGQFQKSAIQPPTLRQSVGNV